MSEARKHCGDNAEACCPRSAEDTIAALRAQRKGLRLALSDAAGSLEAIVRWAAGDFELVNVKGYAANRAKVARAALESVKKAREP